MRGFLPVYLYKVRFLHDTGAHFGAASFLLGTSCVATCVVRGPECVGVLVKIVLKYYIRQNAGVLRPSFSFLREEHGN